MKRLFQLFLALLFLGGVFSSVALAQDGDCCDEYDPAVQQEIDALNKQKAALLGSLSLINSDIEKLRKQSADLDKQLLAAEEEYNKWKDCKKFVMKENGVLEGIVFKTSSAEIMPESLPILNKALEYLKTHPTERYEIGGHCDTRGTAKYNQKLSENRAKSVKQWLVNNGIDAGRLTTVGYSFNKPLVPNTSPENMQKNRRIEYTKIPN
ncbi:MAG: OmpA family protein [Ignavibacteria bacterium]